MENIEDIIRDSLKCVEKLIDNEVADDSLRIIFPKYSDGEAEKEDHRYSEQELKQIFITKLLTNSDLYYSVETPSILKYKFSNQEYPKVDKDGESARIDVSVYGSYKKLQSHIEFKKGSCEQVNIQKDLLKLICENSDGSNYFVHYFSSANNGTRQNALGKYREAVKSIITNNTNVQNRNERLKDVRVFVLFNGMQDSIVEFSLDDIPND